MRTHTLVSMGVFAIVLSAASGIAPAHWSLEDGHKMHDAQMPNPNGWDICLIDQTLADDFVCSESGPVTEIDSKPPSPGSLNVPHVDLELYDEFAVTTPHVPYLGEHASTPFVETDVYNSAWAEIVIFLTHFWTWETVEMDGSMTMKVDFEDATEGDADDDDGDGRDEVPTEIVALNLRGRGSLLGPVKLSLRNGLTSAGQMEEKSNKTPGVLDVSPFADTGTIDSIFDVHVDVEIDGFTYYGANPVHLTGLISHKPSISGEIYDGPQSVWLLDPTGQSTGIRLWIEKLRPSPCIRCGNLDGIGVTDMLDVDEFADNWLWSASGLDKYNPADMDCSGKVDSADLAHLAFTWLGTCK